jgi:hypothetical protein
MIVKLVLLLVLGFAPAFGDNLCDMECFFVDNIEEKELLKQEDLDFCKKFASVLIFELKPAVPEYARLVDEWCDQEESSNAYDSDCYSSASGKLSGFIGRWGDNLFMVENKLPSGECRDAIFAVRHSSKDEWVHACDKAIDVLSR